MACVMAWADDELHAKLINGIPNVPCLLSNWQFLAAHQPPPPPHPHQWTNYFYFIKPRQLRPSDPLQKGERD